LAILSRHHHLENAVLVLGHGGCVSVPIVEVANEVCSEGIGSPFAIYYIAVVTDIKAILLKALEVC
jgi:hypothetical protein